MMTNNKHRLNHPPPFSGLMLQLPEYAESLPFLASCRLLIATAIWMAGGSVVEFYDEAGELLKTVRLEEADKKIAA